MTQPASCQIGALLVGGLLSPAITELADAAIRRWLHERAPVDERDAPPAHPRA